MSHVAVHPSQTAAGGPVPETNVSLTDLPEAVLIQIIARLEDPQPLASTCKTLHAVSTSSTCRQLWFQRWHSRHPVASRRPLSLAALSWHALAWAEEPSATAHPPPCKVSQQQEPSPLLALLCSTACHYLQPEQQQHAAQQVAYQLPSGISTAEVSHALHSTDQQEHLKVLQQLTPWHEHLLLPAVAAAGHYTLLQQLLVLYSPAAAAATNSTAGSSNACRAGMGPDSSSTTSSAGRAGMGADSSSTLQNGMQRLQQWLWQHHDPAPVGDGGQGAPQTRWGQFQQLLPDLPGLKSFEHNVLLMSLTAAAKGGSTECLQLLLGELASCRAGPLVCAEALTTAAEAAAAAGSLDCFQLVRQVLVQPEQQAAEEMDLYLGKLHALRMHTDARRNGHDGQPAGGGSPVLQQQPLAGDTALRWVQASNFLLVAAAQGGCCSVLAHVMEFMEMELQKPQLPAALVAAGCRGHADALQLLLRHPELTATALQMAASSAAVHGWPSATLSLLLSAIERSAMRVESTRYRSQLTLSLLAKPLRLALQQHRQELADMTMAMLARHVVADRCGALADSLLLLAYQGQAARVAWLLHLMPNLPHNLRIRTAIAALEGGHQQLSELISTWGGERAPPIPDSKAATKRGQLTAAVAAGDAAAVRALLHDQLVHLPLVWACETEGPHVAGLLGGAAGPVEEAAAAAAGAAEAPEADAAEAAGAGAAAAAEADAAPAAEVDAAAAAAAEADAAPAAEVDAATAAAAEAHAAFWPQLHMPAEAAGAVEAGGAGYPTHCLLALLKSAVFLQGPSSVDILRQLLWALTDAEGQSHERQQLLLALAKACFNVGRLEQLVLVVEAAGRPRVESRRRFLRDLRSHLQLPLNEPLQQQHHQQQQLQTAGGSCGSSGNGVGSAVDAALALMEQPMCSDVVSSLLTQSYLAVCMPGEYLGSTVRPMQPAAHIPSLQSFTDLLLQLAQKADVPGGARSKDLPLFKLLVRTVLQSCDVYLLHALLLFMQRHWAAVLADMPEDALQALQAEGEAAQVAAAAAEAPQGAVQ